DGRGDYNVADRDRSETVRNNSATDQEALGRYAVSSGSQFLDVLPPAARCPQAMDSAAAEFTTCAPAFRIRCSSKRASGPKAPTDPATLPVWSKNGAAIAIAPTKTSPRLTKYPSSRVCDKSAASAALLKVLGSARVISASSLASRNARIALPL